MSFYHNDRLVDLINYIPPTTSRIKEIKVINSCETNEFKLLYEAIDKLFNNLFIFTADEDGLDVWEKLLGISKQPGDSVEDRRFRIYAQFNSTAPYTAKSLERMLTDWCGAENFSMSIVPANYEILVEVAPGSNTQYKVIEKLLKQIVPANMVLTVRELLTPYSKLAEYTHAELAEYTHNQIRRELG